VQGSAGRRRARLSSECSLRAISVAMDVHDQSGYAPAQEIKERVLRMQTLLRNARVSHVAVQIRTGSDLIITLLACRPLDIGPVIVGPWFPREVVDALEPDCWVRTGEDGSPVVEIVDRQRSHRAEADARGSGLTIFSSGSTGTPKPSRWAWDSLDHSRSPRSRTERWGIGYAPFTFAAVAATCQALGRASTIEYLQPADLMYANRHEPFDVVAGTPSFWRVSAIATITATGTSRPMQVATLGGEPVDRALISTIRSTFAPARIKQIFGTTELGSLLSVDDESPGLPYSLAGKYLPNGVAFDVKNGMLRFSVRPGSPFVETGDTVKIVAGRILITGRGGLSINVGGHKVDPMHVSNVINQHPQVIGARAYPVSSSLLGNVIGIDVVPRDKCNPRDLAIQIKAFSKIHLAPPERPRRVRVTDQLTVAPSGKLSFDE
jgi:acyl-coenzyme A synthetase/AMP-(fatty) acid ligase